MPYMVYYQCHVDRIEELITLTVLWLVISHARRLTSLGRAGCRIVTRPFFSGRVGSGHKTTPFGGIGSVPSEEVSQFGGFKYISGRCATPYLCCWVLQRHIPELSAFQRSPLLYTGEKGRLETSNMCTSLIVMSSLLNQSSAPENLVRESCHCLHYPVNFIQSTICRYIHVAS